MLTHQTQAFYALEEIKIAREELETQGQCNLVSTRDLVAYQCIDSFKVFDVASISAPILVYNTTKAVAQIKASKLVNDPFISFVEARTEEDIEPATFAFVKVVDKDGVRDLGISSKFLPNRSIYLGSNLVLRVNEAESNLQMYDIAT